MNIRKSLIAAAASLALVAGSLLAAAPAQAAVNTISVQGGYTLCFYSYESWGRLKTCNPPGSNAYDQEYLIVPRGQCVLFGQWSFVNYCADGKVDRLVPIGGGYYVAKRSR